MTQAQRILEILGDGKKHGHHEFYGFCVLHSRISELRKRGHVITCARDGDEYVYQLVGSGQSGPVTPHAVVLGVEAGPGFNEASSPAPALVSHHQPALWEAA